MSRQRWMVGLLVGLLWLTGVSARAAIQIPPNARVGLVLSGGGARGLAHVGVLRVLEAEGIKPVVVTGTSMGAIVGALYASGRSAADIDRIARTMDWRQAFSDASPRSHQLYPFRQLEAGMTTDLRMSITRDGIAFPRGVIEGQHLDQMLGDLFAENGRPLQFNQLPVKFAAVASDLATGDAVIMDQGDVASAVRASMSIPGVISPVERNGRLLVDGGIADNMPVALAHKLGANFIIAVDVSAPLLKRDQLTSIFAVANQVTTFLVRRNTVEQSKLLGPHDVLIVPDLDDYSSAAFDQADAIIKAGTEAAMKTFGITRGDLKQRETHPEIYSNTSTPVIDFIRVKNNSPVSDEVVREQIHQPVGQPLDRAQLEEDLSRLYGLDYFSVVRYRVVRENGRNGLEVDSVARKTGNSWLKLGVQLADDFSGNSEYGISASLRSAGLNRYGGTAFTRLQLGTTPQLELRFLQPLDPGLRYFVEPSVGYKATQFDLYQNDIQPQPLARFRKNDRWASLALGRLLWQNEAEFRFGITRIKGTVDFLGGLNLLAASGDSPNYDDGFYFARLGWDSLDDLGFPSHGVRFSLTREEHRSGIGADSDFGRSLGNFTIAASFGRNTVLLEGDAAISDSDVASFADIPFIGGFLELSGLPPRSRFGRHRALVRTVAYRRLDENGPLPVGVPLYMGMSLEKGNVWLDRRNISWGNAIAAGSVFLGAQTPLGPAYLSYGLTDEGDRSLSIYLGQRFR